MRLTDLEELYQADAAAQM
ncbi:MAG TPA: hypothetical protein PKC25_09925, partial [Candidatus Rifleibacterium sp.]|nr:hypothetical protein [Candidatus Rifleibacterium sp.]